MIDSIRDMRVPVQLNAEEYVSMQALAKAFGMSYSGLLRMLLRKAIRDYAIECHGADSTDSDRPAQEN